MSPVGRISVVCPAYEEELVLPRFHAELAAVLDALRPDYDAEVVYVDDGSEDGTLGVLRRLAATDPRGRLLSRRAADALLRLPEAHRFLRGMVHWLGFPTATVRFQVASRGAGVSKFTFGRLTAFAVDALLSFSKVPLRLSLFLGLLFLLA